MFEVPAALCSSILLSISSPYNAPSRLSISSVRAGWAEAAGLSDRAIQSSILAAVSGKCDPYFSQPTCTALQSRAGIYLGQDVDPVNTQPLPQEQANIELQLGRLLGYCE